MVKNPPAVWDIWVQPLGWEDPLEEEMATHSGILAWRIPWTEEPGGLQFMRSQRVRHDGATSTRYKGMYGLPVWCSGKESTSQYRRRERRGFDPWVRKIPWSRI